MHRISQYHFEPERRLDRKQGFSLIEMMVSMAILAFLMMIVFGIIQITSNAWQKTSGRIESLQNARNSFESITRRLGQATLNTYYDYFDSNRNPSSSASYAGPDIYGRRSELHFVSGKSLVSNQVTHAIFFQALLGYTDDTVSYGGMDKLLNACGYYVVYGSDPIRPSFLKSLANPPPEEYRYRLMEYLQPSQKLNLYTTSSFAPAGNTYTWIANGLSSGTYTRPLAQNVVALVVLPTRSTQDEKAAISKGLPSLAPEFEYDSYVPTSEWSAGAQPVQMHQLPPLVKVVMIAIDDVSALRLGNKPTAPDFGQGQLFKNADQLDSDLTRFEAVLNALPGNLTGNALRLNYRIFQTEIAIRGAKWSE